MEACLGIYNWSRDMRENNCDCPHLRGTINQFLFVGFLRGATLSDERPEVMETKQTSASRFPGIKRNG